MLVLITKQGDILKDNPHFDFLNLLHSTDGLIIKPIALIYDTQSPFRHLSNDDKVDAINDYLGIRNTQDFIHDNEYVEIIELYVGLCPIDPLESILDALTHQSNLLSAEVKSSKIKLNDELSKEFDRFMKWSIESLDTTKTIIELRKLTSNITLLPKSAKSKEAQGGGQNISEFLKNKAQNK